MTAAVIQFPVRPPAKNAPSHRETAVVIPMRRERPPADYTGVVCVCEDCDPYAAAMREEAMIAEILEEAGVRPRKGRKGRRPKRR